MYESFTLNALKISEGDQQKADYFLDTETFNYFYRLDNRNKYVDWFNKEQTKK